MLICVDVRDKTEKNIWIQVEPFLFMNHVHNRVKMTVWETVGVQVLRPLVGKIWKEGT